VIARLAPLLEWMSDHIEEAFDVDELAQRAHMSPRTFARRFREQTGTTPLQWLMTVRIRRAQELLETTRCPIDDLVVIATFNEDMWAPSTLRHCVLTAGGVSTPRT
jgi:transcriptional regulator GlxA family with amidase domain